jgi:dipeptidyl aminopeptidase/acylaminoacyl peptidase
MFGDRTVFVRTAIDLGADRYIREIWLHDGAGTRRLTAGPGDARPRWSPDGSTVAFLRKGPEPDSVNQLAVIPVDGGEATVVSDLSRGVESFEWSPDGTYLAAVGVTWIEEWDGLTEEERKRKPRRITRFPYRAESKGWVHDRRRHIWVFDPNGVDEPICVTGGDFDETAPSWSPDGSTIAFVSDRRPEALSPVTQAWEIAVTGGEPRLVSDGMWDLLSYRPDGALHLVGRPTGDWPFVSSVFRRESDGSLTDLMPAAGIGPVPIAGGDGVRWVDDTLYLGYEDAGSVGVFSLGPDGAQQTLVSGRLVVGGFDTDGFRIVYTVSTSDRIPTLVERGGSGERTLFDASVDLGLVAGEHFRVDSDGTEIDVWVYLPPGDGPVPVLLNIHGGPAAQYGFGFFDEFQVYVGAGYGVVAANPRGSSGRGQDFVRAVTGDGWGVVDLADVTAAFEAAVERFPRLDAGRAGVMGGSYGGFLTAWVIGHDNRYRSAIVERALLAWPSFSGTSDIGPYFPRMYVGADHPDGWDRWTEASPISVAHRVTTPTLIVHSENDFRCPIEQGEQYYLAVARTGTPVEFLRFPGESHELSRSGKPVHRLERFEAILDWHGRWLG